MISKFSSSFFSRGSTVDRSSFSPGPFASSGAGAQRDLVARPVPFITVGIPAYNRPHLLKQALESLKAQEDFDDFEVLICDDLGLAETRAVIEESSLRNIRHEINPVRLGAVGNWNRCLNLARGHWITILHEDDQLYPWFLKTVTAHLQPEFSAIVMKAVQGTEPIAASPPRKNCRPRPHAPAFFLKSGITPFPGVVFPVQLGRAINGFDARMGPLADYDFWYRLGCHGPLQIIPATGAFYRLNDDQWTCRVWPDMLRKMHLLRLRIAREQLSANPRIGRWLARFFTYRNALAYGRRFPQKPDTLIRVLRFQKIPGQRLPSGWAWSFLRHARFLRRPAKRSVASNCNP